MIIGSISNVQNLTNLHLRNYSGTPVRPFCACFVENRLAANVTLEFFPIKMHFVATLTPVISGIILSAQKSLYNNTSFTAMQKIVKIGIVIFV